MQRLVKYLVLLIFISFNFRTNAQDSVSFARFFGCSSANDFTINSIGTVYLLEGSSSEILQISQSGKIIKQSGGFGWDDGLFDNPSSVFSNLLSVIVADKNNHRIQIFDKNLNFSGKLNLSNTPRGKDPIKYPIDCAISPQGDYFVLDSENKRVVKFNSSGEYLTEFGGVDAGVYSLKSPSKIIIQEEQITVIDAAALVTFTQFGDGIGSKQLGNNIGSIYLTNDDFYYSVDNQLFKSPVDAASTAKLITKVDEPILKIEIFEGSIYLLTRHAIFKSQN